jgi:hypothetical protein
VKGGNMTTTLTNIEKKSIIDQAIKQLDYSIYSSEIEVIQIEAVTPVDQEQLSAYAARITNLNAKRAALVAEELLLTDEE